MAINIIAQPAPAPSAPSPGSPVVRVVEQQVRSSASTEQKVQTTERKITEQDVQKAVGQANIEIAGTNESIAFGYIKEINLLFVTVTDKNSGEVIREIPSKDFIEHRIAMKEMVGMMLDKQV